LDKKRGLIFLLIGLLLISSFSSIGVLAGVGDGIEDSVEGIKDKAKGIQDTTEEIKEFTEEDRWDYLSERWKVFLSKSKFISGWDAFFSKINWVFVFLMGTNYDISLEFFFALVWWIFTFFVVAPLIYKFSRWLLIKAFGDRISFGRPVYSLIIFAITVILGQLGFYRWIGGVSLRIIFFKTGLWPWVSFFIFLILYFVALISLKKIVGAIGGFFKKGEEKAKEESLEQRVEANEAFRKRAGKR